jgi:ankyrin repeat protein
MGAQQSTVLSELELVYTEQRFQQSDTKVNILLRPEHNNVEQDLYIPFPVEYIRDTLKKLYFAKQIDSSTRDKALSDLNSLDLYKYFEFMVTLAARITNNPQKKVGTPEKQFSCEEYLLFSDRGYPSTLIAYTPTECEENIFSVMDKRDETALQTYCCEHDNLEDEYNDMQGALEYAIEIDAPELFILLLDFLDISNVDYPLHWAIECRSYKVMEDLVTLYEFGKQKDDEGHTPYELAVHLGDLRAMEILENAKQYFTSHRSHFNESCDCEDVSHPFVIAAYNGDIPTLDHLFSLQEKSSQPWVVQADWSTYCYQENLITHAAKNNHLHVIKYLCKRFWDDCFLLCGLMHIAVENGNMEMLKWLVENGARDDSKNNYFSDDDYDEDNDEPSTLCMAIEAQDWEIVEFLLEKDLFSEDYRPDSILKSPLYFICDHSGSVDLFDRVLQKTRADTLYGLEAWGPLLRVAAQNKESFPVLKLLVEKYAIIDEVDYDRVDEDDLTNTAVYLAIESENVEAVKLLVEKNWYPEHVTKQELANESQCHEILKYFVLSYNVRSTRKDLPEETKRFYALLNGQNQKMLNCTSFLDIDIWFAGRDKRKRDEETEPNKRIKL